jgi:hypothetical protein
MEKKTGAEIEESLVWLTPGTKGLEPQASLEPTILGFSEVSI